MLWTQELALQRELHMPQTLTAIHDKSVAWFGLGSALYSLWRQRAVSAALWGVFAVAAYLAAISALHFSIPALFSLQPFSGAVDVPTRQGLVNL